MTDPRQSLLNRAISLQQAGDVRAADQICRQLLAADPRDAQAWHLLGLIAYQVNQQEAALQCVTQAIRLDGRDATFHGTLGEVLRRLNRVPDAIASYRRALQLRPDYPEAHSNLGTLLQAQGDLAAAEVEYREAVRLSPRYVQAQHNLGFVLQQQGRWDEAAAAFTEAVRLQPDFQPSAIALAGMLEARGQSGEAQSLFARLADEAPHSPLAQCAVGCGYQARGDYRAAEASYRRAIELDPNYAEAYYNLAGVLNAMNRDLDAIAAYEHALRLNPHLASAWTNLANSYLRLVRPDDAVTAAQRSLELAPRSHTAMANLALALQMQADLDGTIAALRRTLELNPADAANHSNLVYTLNFHPAQSAESLAAEHFHWARLHAEPLTAQAQAHVLDRSPNRRLRVGYVSAHFRDHAVSYFSEPLLAAHDRDQIEIHCYADLIRSDSVTERFRSIARVFRETTLHSDGQVAEMIRADQIDILVDLAGHIGGNRLLVFARKPAPVQVTYLGYQNTTGMSAMDYRLTDAYADPPNATDRFYSEQLVRLPGMFFCYGRPAASPDVAPLPAAKSGHVTFASLNNMCKLTDQAFETWARILARVPGSQLVVLGYSGGVFERRVRGIMERCGIADERIVVVDKRPRYDYFELHNHLDIALDTFPFSGHTTICDALWMGVPSVVMEGDRYASRFGASTLAGMGLEEWIARSPEEYVELAARRAGEVPRLAELRGTLRERLRRSPLMDATTFAREVETAYRRMWQAWSGS